ncbi:MAG: hypothetical protein CMH56_04410 [Myxococcales bacterium]|nr:hypothetical protein [Myxococcales bacterium]|tara:strand:+ start:139 stop:1062 length:924 start_codon:yes stop_codon:yes gene_type:complete
MDPITVLLTITTVGFGLFAANEAKKKKEARASKQSMYAEVDALKGKLEKSRQELGKTKESLSQKTKNLDEMRNQARKKERRESKAQQRQEKEAKRQNSGGDHSLMQEEIKNLKGSLSAMEHQVLTMQKELDEARSSANEEAQDKWGAEVSDLKERLQAAETQTQTATEALEKFKQKVQADKEHKAKYPTPLDLDNLDKEVVNELARYYRKSEHYQRLYNVAEGNVRMAQDRAADLQRRYREVCRELALVAGAQSQAGDAVATAEAIVSAVATDAKHDARFGSNTSEKPNGVEVSNEKETPEGLPTNA